MSEMAPTTRRSFLKKTVTTTAIVGGALASADPAAAASTELVVRSYDDSKYSIVVNDDNATTENDMEDDIIIESGKPSSGKTTLSGYIASDKTHTFYFDGRATDIWLKGDVEVDIVDPTEPDNPEDVVVTGEPTDYGFTTNCSILPNDDCESNDEVNRDTNTVNGTIETSSDTDSYQTCGVITYATILSDSSVRMVQE